MDLIKIISKDNNIKKIIINGVYECEIKIEEVDKTQAFNKTELIKIILKEIRNNKEALKFMKDKELRKINLLV